LRSHQRNPPAIENVVFERGPSQRLPELTALLGEPVEDGCANRAVGHSDHATRIDGGSTTHTSAAA